MTNTEFTSPLVAQIAAFLRGIGLDVRAGALPAQTLLPGIWIDRGALLVDEARLLYPGDMLHEAGHLAVAHPARRAAIVGDAGADPAEEMMALAWSYAAALAIPIDPGVVFHPAGYHGDSQALIDNFQAGRCVGLPMLQWLRMAYDSANAPAQGVPPFPHMVRWLRDDFDPTRLEA